MDLNPPRFAVIAVHMQNNIVTAEGAYGGFFAAQATSRDVIGITGKLLDATRARSSAVLYTRVAWQPGYPEPGRELAAARDGRPVSVPRRGQPDGRDRAGAGPQGR